MAAKAKAKAPLRAAKGKTPPRAAKGKAPRRAAKSSPAAPPDVAALLAELERNGSEPFRADMPTRYGIVTQDRVFGTPMAKIKQIAKGVSLDHQLAEALWQTGVYEARMLASLVDDPERVTPAQMTRWAKDFDNWAVVDTLCFNLFDRTPHAFAQVNAWSKSKREFVKRAAFALLASVALHGHGTDDDFQRALTLIVSASTDERNFVKKGVSWALRAIGRKKSPKLQAAARALATQLAASEDASARWIGKDALKDFGKKA
jgi:3-methyladenine DNA glycosylase AlkD